MFTTLFRRLRAGLPAVVLFVLSACGGGGEGDNNTSPAAPTVAPAIAAQPASVSVTAGATATFNVGATGGAPLTYQWRRNGADITGATSASYTTPVVSNADSGAQFTVGVSNNAGAVTSDPATLTVGTPIAPSVVTQPQDASVVAPAAATFSVVASGTTPMAFQWYRNGAAIAGATGAQYETPATTVGGSDTFQVVVTNAAGSVTSRSATLTVAGTATAPTISSAPSNLTVNAGQTASFDVSALGTPRVFSYQWRRNGIDIPGATARAYTTAPTTAADNGVRFSVVVSNSAGSVTSPEATLSVVSTVIAPSIGGQPQSMTVREGASGSFVVAAGGTAPLAYQWRRNGVNLPSANSLLYLTPPTTLADSGAIYTVVVSNSAGSVTSQPATLTVSAIAPAISTGPAAQSVTAPAPATFNVVAVGSGPLTYQWRRNGTNIAGATAASYTTPATTVGDTGSLFSVVVSNTAGSVTSNGAILSVTSPAPSGVTPAIVSQPQNLTLPAGTAATFSVSASGSTPLTYQWRRNGVDIVGATGASYTRSATSSADNGASFTVVVLNAAGSATSATAVLTVTAASTFPNRPVTLVVPFAAGGLTDLLARDLRDAMVADQGWSVVVENVAGAGGTTGMTRVANAAADGHTLLLGSTEVATAPTLYRSWPVQPLTAYAHLGLIDEMPMVLASRRGIPGGTYGTLASWLDAQTAGSVRLADAGLGSPSHLCALLFASRDGNSFNRVRYSGAAPATTDLIGGQVDLFCDVSTTLRTHVESGNVQAYGVTALSRSLVPTLAALQTLDESGLPGFDATRWNGLHAPQGTPPEVLAKINAALRTALVNPEFVRRQVARGSRVVDGARLTPDGHRQFLQNEADKWRPLIQAAGEYAN